MNKILYIFLLSIIVASGCRKDIESENTEIIILAGEDIETNLHGRIITPSGNSVSEAEITIGNSRTFSNNDGYFYFLDLIVPEDGFSMEISSPAYTKSIRRIIPQSNNNTYEEVTLIPEPFNNLSETGVQTLHSDSLELVSVLIPGNSLVDENNNSFSGFYTCKITYYDPANNQTLRTMPGNLEGINQNGEKVTLGSLGMIYINVQTENGLQLYLAENATATVILNYLPQKIDSPITNYRIWSLDDDSGLWLEENIKNEFGMTESSTSFVFDIPEFTFWNCDVPFDNTCVNGTIFSDIGYPIENRQVQLSFIDDEINYLCTGGNTNNIGTFEAKLPRNKVINLSIYDRACNNVIFTDEIGPFSSDQSSIDEIKIPFLDQSSVITGNILSCQDLPAENATVFLLDFQDNVRATTQTDKEGRFSLHDLCKQDLFSLKVLDLDNMTTTVTGIFEFTETELNIGEIITCQSQDSSFINIESSNIGAASFLNPEFLTNGDSLIILAENNSGSITLIASLQDEDSVISFIEIIQPDQRLTCTSEHQHTICGEHVEFSSLIINDNVQKIDGIISGILFNGNIEEEETTIGQDVTITFSGFY